MSREIGVGGYRVWMSGRAHVSRASGIHTGLHTEYRDDGTWGLQAIAAYNWGGDFLWSRARLTRRVADSGSEGATALGAELVWQAETDDDDPIEGNECEAIYVGPVLQFNRPGGTAWR